MKAARYFKSALAVVVLAGAAVSAQAQTCIANLCDLGVQQATGTTIGNKSPYNVGPLYAEPAPGDTVTFKGVIAQTAGAGSIDTTWYFTTSLPSLFLDHAQIIQSGFTAFTAKLYDSANNLIATFVPGIEQFMIPLANADTYHFVITGNFSGAANYTFVGQIVPLPAAAWLLLSGVAGLGAMARRRKVAAEA